MNIDDQVRLVRHQDKRAIARTISQIESGEMTHEQVMEIFYPLERNSFRVGVTGPPGVGKSTLLGRLITHVRSQGLTVAVIAIDPSSPFTGGALLGDRVRMTGHTLDEGVFIRSMGSKGSQTGVSSVTREVLYLLDAAKFDVVFVETVGVGQTEWDIMHYVDSVMLVLHPESGDLIQVLKAGIMEIAHLLVVNKADLAGAARLEQDLLEMIHLVYKKGDWSPSVVKTTDRGAEVGDPLNQSDGIRQCWEELMRHRAFLQKSGQWQQHRLDQLRQAVVEMIEEQLRQKLTEGLKDPSFQQDINQVWTKQKNPVHVSAKWFSRLMGEMNCERG